MEVLVTTGAIRRVQSSSQIITTNKPTQLFTGRMPFLSPYQQCQSTEGRKYHSPPTCSPQAHLGFFKPYLRPLKEPGKWLSWGKAGSILRIFLDSTTLPSLPSHAFPFPSLPSRSLPYHPLPLEVGPLNPARGSGERCKLPQLGLGQSPSRILDFGAF